MANKQTPQTISDALGLIDLSLVDPCELTLAIESLQAFLPPAPVQQGKVINVTFTAAFDLAVPSQRDKWFESLDSAPRFVANRDGKLFIGTLVVGDQQIAEIKSTDLSQATFFRSVCESYPVWVKKNGKVKETGVGSAGRVNEQKVRDLHMFGFTAAEIAADLGRDESLIQEVMTRLGLVVGQ